MRHLIHTTIIIALGIGFATGCGPAQEEAAGGPPPMMPTQVVAVPAKLERVADMLSLIGTVAAQEMVEIKSETAGIVETIHFLEGQKVKKGQLLIELNREKLHAAVVEAEANLALSESNFLRNKELLGSKLISKQEFDQTQTQFQAQQALVNLRKRQLQDTHITAPFDGTVGARVISPGQVVSPNSTLTWVVSLDNVNVEFNVPERFLSVCKTGQTIDVKVAAYPDNVFSGSVFFVAPFVETELRTTLVKALLPNPEALLKPGMFATLDVTLTIREKAVVIPEPSLFRTLDDERAMVYVIDEENLAQLRTVKVGERKSKKVEITQGLSEGEIVIVEGTQKIGPGSLIKLAPPESAAIYQ
ncbi:MAG: efflux RND transporter periplasmic adaptor subunit [Verrucomicrobia bacterium]|nr:efflux RND transporter periplasmic adaptor subunit [Verrucomicrobiota bacterium]